jgi:endonuclease/exonuclease/phosphatase family metal-dependent hydrolase
VTVTTDVTLGSETTSLKGDRNNLSVANYNLENLDPNDSAQKFDILAKNIVYNLQAPDIVAVQEMQDGNGLNGPTRFPRSRLPTFSSPRSWRMAAPAMSMPRSRRQRELHRRRTGGNIRNGFFYNPDRVTLVNGGLSIIEDPAFSGSRKPLVGNFMFNGEQVTVINVHLTSRLGSEPLWGAKQPPADGGAGAREAQTAAVRSYVDGIISKDGNANLIVTGDFNGFYFEKALTQLETGDVLTNLHRLLPEEERYSYQFGGNLQALDNMLASGGLTSSARFDAVHINSELPEGTFRGTDHDALVATFRIQAPNEAPVARADSYSVARNGKLEVTGPGVLGNDTDIDGDALAAALVSGPLNGTLTLGADGAFIYTPNAGYVGTDSFTYRASDGDGAGSNATVSVTVEKVPTRVGDGQRAERTGGAASEDLRANYAMSTARSSTAAPVTTRSAAAATTTYWSAARATTRCSAAAGRTSTVSSARRSKARRIATGFTT